MKCKYILWKIFSLTLFSLMNISSCIYAYPNDLRIRSETEDRETDLTQDISNSNILFDLIINEALDEVRLDKGIGKAGGKKLSKSEIDDFLEAVFFRLGKNIQNTGIIIGFWKFKKELAPLVAIEKEIMDTFADSSIIVRATFKESRYGNNPIGWFAGREWSHKTIKFANHSIAPTIRLSDTLIGIDKLGHFLQQGYWYEHSGLEITQLVNWGKFLEGDTTLDVDERKKYRDVTKNYCKSCAKFGYFGLFSTGVISHADIEANIYGFQFFQRLRENPWMSFSISDWDLKKLNEVLNPSDFNFKLDVKNNGSFVCYTSNSSITGTTGRGIPSGCTN